MKHRIYTRFAWLTIAMTLVVSAYAADTGNPSKSIEYQINVQRACEVAIWAMPAVSVYDIELSIQRNLGGTFGDACWT